MHCIGIICDFVLMTQYRSHDKDTLQYIKQVLYKIDKLKIVFKEFRSKNKIIGEKHFNISKGHVMIHYIKSIGQGESIDEFDTSYNKATHKYLIKNFYDKINKRKNGQAQILLHNIGHVNMQVMNDVFVNQEFLSIF